MIPITRGSSVSQQAVMSWSKRRRGRLALNQTKAKQKIHVLSAMMILWRLIKEYCSTNTGRWKPPKKKILVRALIRIILLYSARKKKTKIIPL